MVETDKTATTAAEEPKQNHDVQYDDDTAKNAVSDSNPNHTGRD